MQFSAALRERVANGTITVPYGLWSRSKVKVGGVYRSGSVMVEVDDIEFLPFSSISDEDLVLTGEADRESLRRRAACTLLARHVRFAIRQGWVDGSSL